MALNCKKIVTFKINYQMTNIYQIFIDLNICSK